jgi:pyridinium-3,5-bisthiocarboxylic acid mononucleotide nickel chelatase
MKIGYIECFAGMSGDMFLGALVDAGASFERLQQVVAGLNLGAELRIATAVRSGISARKIAVIVDGHEAEAAAEAGVAHHHSHGDHHHDHDHHHNHHHEHHEHHHSHEHSHQHAHGHEHSHERTLPVILNLIRDASLEPNAEALAVKAFRLLAASEAKIHGISEDEVHFHEVGAIDAIVDIIATAVALTDLGIEKWYCSAINVGSGSVECAHGLFPVPAPATAELLKGLPTYSAGPQMEMVTPTGAALLRAVGVHFLERPLMATEQIGYGAGSRDPQSFPNVVRIMVGEDAEKGGREKIAVLECAVDDQSPELLAHVLHQALAHGALDVMLSPVTMKKSRLGTLLTVLAPPAQSETLATLLLKETSTLGVRLREEERICLDRDFEHVETSYGTVRVKVGLRDGEPYNYAPEFEDCKALAESRGVPLKEVMTAALAAVVQKKEEMIKA